MQKFDLVKYIEKHKEISQISIKGIETSDEARSELDKAEAAYFRYKKMYTLIINLDFIVDDLDMNSPEWELMTEEDHCETLEHCSVDAISLLKNHLKDQTKKFANYCKDLEAAAEEIEAEERDIEKFGSYEDQVRSHFYSTR